MFSRAMNCLSPSTRSGAARGLTNVAVPTATAEAPARMNSSASSTVRIPHSQHGDLDGPGGFPDHPHGDRPDGRPGQASRSVREARTPRPGIDRHSDDRVDERYPVRPASSAARAKSAIRPTFGESFTISGLSVDSFRIEIRALSWLTSVPNSIPPALTFGQGDVHLQGVHTLDAGQSRGDGPVLVDRLAEDVDDHARVEPAKVREFIFQESFEADVLETDRVQYPRRRLDNPGEDCPSAGGARSPS